MALAPLSPATQTYLTHTPPSATHTRSTKRNTVHWDQYDLIPSSVKENAAPEPYKSRSPASQKSGSLRTAAPSPETPLDFGNWKPRGQYRRTPLAAETFIAPEVLNRAVETSADSHQGTSLIAPFSAGEPNLQADCRIRVQILLGATI